MAAVVAFPKEEQDLGDFYKAYGYQDEKEQMSDFFKDNGFYKSPFGYVPPKPGDDGSGNTLMHTSNLAKKARKAFNKGMGLMPDLPGIQEQMDNFRRDEAGWADRFDTSDLVKSGNAARSYSRDVAVDAANTAASEFATQRGGNKTGAAMLRAKALLPAMQGDASIALQIEEMKQSNKIALGQALSETHSKMADLQSNYIGTLADYNSNKAQNALGYANLMVDSKRQDRDYRSGKDSELRDWYNQILQLRLSGQGISAPNIQHEH